jgi:PPOX class probable F420-dependent enzyme
MPTMDDVRTVVRLDHGLATVATTRSDGTVQATVVHAGVVDHPGTGDPVAAFVARRGTRKLAHLRARPALSLTWRAGWAWTTLEGEAELAGPEDPADGVGGEVLRRLLREIFTAAGGGEHEDWAEYDRTMVTEGRTAVLVPPRRIYVNP